MLYQLPIHKTLNFFLKNVQNFQNFVNVPPTTIAYLLPKTRLRSTLSC